MPPTSPTFLLILVCAHILGDFLFPPSRASLIFSRNPLGDASRLLAYALRHAVLAFLVSGAVLAWELALTAGALHLALRLLFSWIEQLPPFDAASTPRIRTGLFGAEHAAYAISFWLAAPPLADTMDLSMSLVFGGPAQWPVAALIGGTGAVFTLFAGSRLIERLTAGMLEELEQQRSQQTERSQQHGTPEADGGAIPRHGLSGGGRWIGLAERALLFLFVIFGMEIAIGFLIAAKSILRFGEIRNRVQRMEAEYVIIGTLISFAWGILGGWLTLRAIAAFVGQAPPI
jgi:hypothetical protein